MKVISEVIDDLNFILEVHLFFHFFFSFKKIKYLPHVRNYARQWGFGTKALTAFGGSHPPSPSITTI